MEPGPASGISGDGDEHRFQSGLLVAQLLQPGGQLAGECMEGGRGEVEAEEFDGDPPDGDFGVTDASVELVEAVLELLSLGRYLGIVVDVSENRPDDIPHLVLDAVGVEVAALAAVLGPPTPVGTDVVAAASGEVRDATERQPARSPQVSRDSRK
jgi:hypothetical protein